MFEYALTFFETYPFISYSLLTIAVILEWPIVILTISFISDKLGFSYFHILLFAFIWDFWGDMLYFLIGRKFRKFVLSRKKIWKIKYIYRKMENYSLFDKLIIIKYTPPITILWLLYLWLSQISIKEFVSKNSILCLMSSLIMSILWYSFWKFFISQKENLEYISLGIWISIIMIYFIIKYIRKSIRKYIKKKHKNF